MVHPYQAVGWLMSLIGSYQQPGHDCKTNQGIKAFGADVYPTVIPKHPSIFYLLGAIVNWKIQPKDSTSPDLAIHLDSATVCFKKTFANR